MTQAITEDTLRRMKAMGLSDEAIGLAFDCKASVIKKLRRDFGIAGLRPNFRSPHKGRPKAETMDGWPVVMSAEQRDRRWTRYFKRLGRDHSQGDVRLKPGRTLSRPDISHLHGRGASSLDF